MNAAQQIPWKRLSVEGFAIVVSILLAFAIDAWWEERGDRQAEIVLLERLQADFIELSVNLKVVEDDHRGTLAACVDVLEYSVGDTLPVSAIMDRQVGSIFLSGRTFNPGSGAVGSFLAGGDARKIRNQELAHRLMAWPGIFEELQEEEIAIQKGIAERWTPYLASKVNIGPYLATYSNALAGIPSQVAEPATRNTLAVDEIFLNHVLDRFRLQKLAVRDIEPVREAVEEILALIDEDLG